MQLSYFGQGCATFIAAGGVREGESRTVLNPFVGTSQERFPRVEADVVVCSTASADASSVQGTPFVIAMSGEYEVKGVMVDRRTAVGKDGAKRAIVRLVVEEMMVGWLGDLDRPLTSDEADMFAGIDMLWVAVGVGGMPSAVAVEVAQELEPRVIVVMGEAQGVLAFRKAYGAARVEEAAGKWKILKKQLPQEDTLLVVLTGE